MGLDPAQVLLPAQMLAVDLAQIADEEGILLADAASVLVDSLDAALQGLPNQLFCLQRAMVNGRTKSMIYRL